MKNKKSMLAALALSAALAVGGSLPAFAAGASDFSVGTDKSTGQTASTNVGLATIASSSVDTAKQIVVSVPLSMTVVAQQDGGDIYAPSATAYQIVNGSSEAVKVVPSYQASSSYFELNIVTDSSKANASTEDGAIKKDGNLFMQLTATDCAAWTLGGTNVEWNLPKGSSTSIAVTGSTSKLAKTFDSASGAPTVVTVTYTASLDEE